MPSFEEEAFARAQQMHRRSQSGNAGSSSPQRGAARTYNQAGSQTRKEENREEPKSEKHKSQSPDIGEKSTTLDNLFQDKERSLIMILLVLLMDEKPDPTLLLSLMYILL